MAKAVFRVDCGDFEVTIGGQTFRPHEGEWVDFNAIVPVEATLAFDRARQIEVGPETFAEYIDAAIAHVGVIVRDWNWTDGDGDPLPLPRTDPEAGRRLSEMELGYLLRKHLEALAPSETEKKSAQSPLTTSSEA